MDNTPRRWVLKPLSPPLQPSDLRSMTGLSRAEDDITAPDGLAVRARQVIISPNGSDSGDEQYPSCPDSPDSPGSASGSRYGFYSFVEDLTSPEAELNEAWMLSPQRQVHLTTLKEDKAFKVQTYSRGKKTERLFTDSESQYQVQPVNHCQVFGEEEEKQLRKEIIQNQAPKKNSTFKLSDQLSVLEKLDWSQPSNMPTKGFGLSYSPVRLEPTCLVDPATIDRAQINFSAARQQFMKMEHGQRNVLVDPGRSSLSCKMAEVDATPSETGKVQTFSDNEQKSGPSGILNNLDLLAMEDLSVEVCCGSISAKEVFDDSILQTTRKGKSDIHDETPIEKEIRLAQEREENLRRARGLKHSDRFSAMVEIQTKRVQTLPVPHKAKEKNHESIIIQQENHEGRGPAPPKELLDTEKQFQEDLQDQEVFLSPCCPHRHAEETTSSLTLTLPLSPRHVPSWTRTLSWRANQESTGLQCRKKGGPDFIEKEIEEALQREQELHESRQARKSLESRQSRESRESRGSRQSTESRESGETRESRGEFRESSLHSVAPLMEQASKMTAKTVYPIENSGLTGVLLRDFEERRERLKMDDSSYAGIQPIDYINNQVVESTRVIRHKNQRALRWEAGVFANQLHQ